MKYDYVSLYNKNAEFWCANPRLKRVIKIGNFVLIGLFILAYAILWAYALFIEPLNPKELVRIAFPPPLALLIAGAIRLAMDCPRPYAENGSKITPILRKKSNGKSFPCLLLTFATAVSTVFLSFFPAVGGLMLAWSVLFAYVRFTLGLHYPSDLLMGMGLGIAAGSFVFVL